MDGIVLFFNVGIDLFLKIPFHSLDPYQNLVMELIAYNHSK